jgi:hypothetical protein
MAPETHGKTSQKVSYTDFIQKRKGSGIYSKSALLIRREQCKLLA